MAWESYVSEPLGLSESHLGDLLDNCNTAARHKVTTKVTTSRAD